MAADLARYSKVSDRPSIAECLQRNYASQLVLTSFCLATALVGWSTSQRYEDFLNYHQGIAASAAGELAHVIADSLVERRLVRVFADTHAELIRAVAQDTEDAALQERLNAAVRNFFPKFFAFTLTAVDGSPLLQDFDGYVGELCLEDMRTYARSGDYNVCVHPNAHAYHRQGAGRGTWR